MNILVLNSGSSTIKYKIFEDLNEIKSGIVEDVKKFDLDDIVDLKSIDIVGHRVVHGGDIFNKATKVTKDIIEKIRELIPLAPLHNPSNLKYIEMIFDKYPHLTQVAVFDTAFHQTIDKEHFLYPLPYEYYKKYHIRKYGFHGISVEYITNEFAKLNGKNIDDVNIIVLHLGSGASATLVKNGKSYDTSMGFTPLEGLMMGTRCGDIDPAILFYLEEHLSLNSDDLNNILNKKSGLLGVCGTNDMREILQRDDIDKILALDMFCLRVQKYIGAYMIQIKNLDAIVFTGGIGENSVQIRDKITKNLDKSIKIVTIPTNEELNIAIQTKNIINKDINMEAY